MEIKFFIILIFGIILCILLMKNNKLENYINTKRKNHFKLIITTYNPGIEFLKKCLKSILIQTYKNYKVIIVDDASTKESKEIKNLLKYYKLKYNFEYIQTKENKGPCYSRDLAIHSSNLDDEDILVLIDGDDELYDKYVLEKLNNYYSNEDILITFGNYVRKLKNGIIEKRTRLNKRKINLKRLIKKKAFRKSPFFFSHLKTCKYKLYKKINKEDLKDEKGNFIRSATDIAIMYPMLEMAGDKIKFIEDKMYKYTYDHEESFHNNLKKKRIQTKNYLYLSQKKIYPTIDFNKKDIYIFYINLSKRTDRKKKIEIQLNKFKKYKKYNFNIQRINAIKDNFHGGIGCAKSHIKTLLLAKKLNLESVIIAEDDIVINNNLIFNTFEIINKMKKINYDVLILSGHGDKETYENENDISRAVGIQTTCLYLVKKHYFDKLINVFQESADNMEKLKNKNKDIEYNTWAIDQNWKKLQKKDNWYILNNLLAYQNSDFSDIENSLVDYSYLYNN